MTKNSTLQQAQTIDPDLLQAQKAYEATIKSHYTKQVMAMYDKTPGLLSI